MLEINELLRRAFKDLLATGLRSNLTILGIVIAVAAIVSLVAIGQGLNDSVSNQFQNFGTKTLFVTPGKNFMSAAFAHLQDDDAKTIESVQGVEFAAAIYMATMQVEFRNEKKTVMVIAVDQDKILNFADKKIVELQEGRLLYDKKFDAVMGDKFSHDFFGSKLNVGNGFYIGGRRFEVVGSLKSSQSFFSSFFRTAIIVDIADLKSVSSETFYPSRILVQLKSDADNSIVQARIKNKLKHAHGEEDFRVTDPQQISETASSVVGIIQLVLLGIALISLLVGGVGVMNTMYMNVSERTPEIGIMKAIGATDSQVLSLFLAESGLMGLIGGIIGAVIGVLASLAVSFIGDAAGFPISAGVSPALIIGALAFAFFVGVVCRLAPAIEAAKNDNVV